MPNAFRPGVLCLLGAVIGIAAPVARATELVEGSDPRAAPFKKAVAALVKEIGDGSLERARAAYAGEGADLELLKAYVEGVAADKALRAAVDAKFGADAKREWRTLIEGVARTGVHDFNTVIFSDDPDAASSSADSPLGVGIDFKRVNGDWKVQSLASRPNTAEQHAKLLKDYVKAVEAVAAKVKSGGYANEREARAAAAQAEFELSPFGRSKHRKP